MLRCIRFAAWLLAFAPLALVPRAAGAFEAVDVLTPSTSGRYPAYPSEGLPLRNFWAQLGGMYDNNLLRRPSGDNDDFVTRLGIGTSGEQRIVGRQRVFWDARADGFIYNRFGAIDNVGWSGLGEWRYEVGNDLSGVLGGSIRQFQASLSEIQRDELDRITEKRAVGTAAYALGPHARLRGGVELLAYSRPAHSFTETRSLIGMLGADWVTALGNTLGVEMHDARGDAPVDELVDPTGIFVNNDYRQRDLALAGSWVSMNLFRFAGRYGRTERSYSVLPGRDYSGPTWLAILDILPGNKTVLTFEASKHISSLIEIGASHALVQGWAVGPSWAATAKLNFMARLMQQNIDYEGDPSAALGVTSVRRETVRNVRVGTYWEYDRQLHWQLAVDHGTRTSNFDDRGFRYTAGMVNARYNFW